MFNKKVLFLIAVLALWATLFNFNVSAIESEQYCIDSDHKYWERNIYNMSSGIVILSLNETTNCSYGCLRGKCLPAPTESHDMSIILGIMAASFILLYSAFHTSKKHAPLQILFIVSGLLFVVIGLSVLSEISDNSAIPSIMSVVDNGYQLSIWIVIIVIFYFIIMFIWEALTKYKEPGGLHEG